MRYLVLSDIHANLEALDVCLADAASRRYDRTLVLGDLVGYGADPNAVIARVIALRPTVIVRGNHDKVACGIEQPEGFNVAARRAALWTQDALTPEHREWLAALPLGPLEVDGLVQICHGSPFDEDAYIFDERDVRRALDASTRPLCLFGHTHYQVAFQLSSDDAGSERLRIVSDAEIALQPGSKYLVNPGSVGQPRDADPRAGYALVDTDAQTVEVIRLAYPIEAAQAKIVNAGLPETLASRLALGR